MDALLSPLPADWRHNIQKAFSDMGEALGKLMGGGQQGGQRVSERRCIALHPLRVAWCGGRGTVCVCVGGGLGCSAAD